MNNILSVDFNPVVEPILEILDAILWPAIAVVVAVGTIYCIVLGVKIPMRDEQKLKRKSQEEPDRRNHWLCHNLRIDLIA